MEISLGLALLAGLLSFLSPCVLALVPVYLAFLGEAAGSLAPTTGHGTLAIRAPLLGQAALFVLGFGLLFIVVGTSVGWLGMALLRAEAVRQAAGIGVIGLGVLSTGLFGPVLDRFRIGLPAEWVPQARGVRAAGLGALVAVGWVPCIGPVLGAILTMGLSSLDVLAATALLAAYSLGLAIPFLACAVALPALQPLLTWLRRHHAGVQLVSGLFIVLIGVLILTNTFARLSGLFTFFI